MKWGSFSHTWHKLLQQPSLFPSLKLAKSSRYHRRNLFPRYTEVGEKRDRTISGDCELYPGILDHFTRPWFFTSCVGGIRMLLWSSVMTVSTNALSPWFSPQPQKLQKVPSLTWHETYPNRWTNFTATKLPLIGAVNQPLVLPLAPKHTRGEAKIHWPEWNKKDSTSRLFSCAFLKH